MRFGRLIISLAVLGTGSVQAAGEIKPASKVDDPERLICRREVETGSLVKSRKICLTAKQWDQWRLESQRAYETMNPRIGGERGN